MDETVPLYGLTRLDLVAATIGYLAGSIPFGLVLTRLAGLGDIRSIGSGNIGATNVLRTGNKPLAAATLLLDSGKGAFVALLAGHLWGPQAMLLAGLFAVVGHNFPIWLRFQGGKGVATTLGVLLVFSWQAGLMACATWLVVALIFRYSSLAALVALAAAPFYMAWWVGASPAVIAGLLTVLAFVRHHENIRRLLAGTESRIGAKKKAESPDA
ncbi:MAG: glycerol-3-phosphate 1-O-acyltransferase PlsY [Rhodobacterales bacterium]|nr:glycerol-3-phosphate 1-O-acyltransferase PlsY [Rhodobacterales bacterium]